MGIFDSLKKGVAKLVEPWQKKNETEKKQIEGSFCPYCGKNLENGFRFCYNCGKEINVGNYKSNIFKNSNDNMNNQMLKCPNCGSVIAKRATNCLYCGIKFDDKSHTTSVKEFSHRLMEIEKGRKEGIFGIGKKNVNNQILMLIKTFPIPNSVDEILEFILLANANINVDLSKRSFWGNSSSEAAEISNAWVTKMQLAYQKAEILFSDDTVFLKIQKIYLNKMKELKIKVK